MSKALKQKQEYGIPLSRYTVFLQNCPLGHDPKASAFFVLFPSYDLRHLVADDASVIVINEAEAVAVVGR